MPAYVWKGKTREGKAVSGERVADSKEAVMALLRRDQILVSSVKEKGKEMAIPKFGGGVPAKSLAVFTRQFSVMIDAGLPLVQCLEILGTQQDNKTFAKILQQTRMDVEGGASLADAMRKLIDMPWLRARMSVAARRKARDFTASAIVPRIETIYAQVTASRHGREKACATVPG